MAALAAPMGLSSPESEADFFAELRLDQSYNDAAVAVEDLILQVPIRKPAKTEFIRVHPEYRFDTQMIDMREDGGIFLVATSLVPVLADLANPVSLRLSITRNKSLFIWPLKLQKGDRTNDWNESALAIAHEATTRWLSVHSGKNSYNARAALGDFGEPAWPAKTWPKLFRIATANRVISTLDHPVARTLLGLE